MKKTLFGIFTFLLCISYVLADDYTYAGEVDINNKINYSIIDYTQGNSKRLHVRFTGMSNIVSGVNFSSIVVNMGGYYTCEGENTGGIELPTLYDDRTHLEKDITLTKIDNDTWDAWVPSLWLFTTGYDTFKFGFLTSNTCYKSSSTLSVDRTTYTNTKLPPVDQRYSLEVGLSSDGMQHFYIGEEHPVDKGLKINANYPFTNSELEVKYGLIQDAVLLEDLKNNVDGVYDRVIEYAKNDNDGLTFNQINIGGNDILVYNYTDVPIVKNGIYYFYVKYKNKGKNSYNYTGTDGIVLGQGSEKDIPTILTTVDFNKLPDTANADDPTNTNNPGDSGDIETNNPTPTNNANNDNQTEKTDKEKTSGTTENPNTGLSISIIIICILLIAGIGIYKYNKKKIYKL